VDLAVEDLVRELDSVAASGGDLRAALHVARRFGALDLDLLGRAFAHARRTGRDEDVKRLIAALLVEVSGP
jgi:hypothetical protein